MELKLAKVTLVIEGKFLAAQRRFRAVSLAPVDHFP
jgi:hypothetical protein